MSATATSEESSLRTAGVSDLPRQYEIAILAFLLGLYCLRVWGFGITHTDDAYWIMRAYEGIDQPGNWARDQGRIWALPIGAMIQHALVWQNTVYGEVLRLGSFVVFFAMFHWTIRVYCGYRLALLCATLFLAFSMLRWDGSILTTYPLLTWVSGIVLVCAVLMGRAYIRSGKPVMAWGAGLALYLSLFNNEGVTVLFAVIFFLSVLANASQADHPGRGLVMRRIPRRTWHLLLLLAGASALYAASSFVWLRMYPSSYDGHGLAKFDLARVAIALSHFSTSGSVLHDLISPYSTVYVDASTGNARQALYRIAGFGRGLQQAPLALMAGLLLAWLSFVAVARRPAPATHAAPVHRMTLLAGLSIAILPVLPVTLTSKYQGWALEMGVKAYSHTILAHFGWSLFLAGLILMAWHAVRRRAVLRKLSLTVLVLSCGLLGTLTFRANDQIANDMRPEAGRWRIVDTALAMNQSVFNAPLLWIPRLASGSWYAVVADEYWTGYVRARYAVPTRISALAPEMNDARGGFVMLDYAFENDGADVISLATQYRTMASGLGHAVEKIAIHFKRPNALTLKDYVLAFEDGTGRSIRTRFTDLKKAGDDGAIRVFANPPADARAIRVLRLTADGKEIEVCATRLAPGFRILLGKDQIKSNQHHVPRFLLSEGWHPVESGFAWSKGARSLARVESSMLPAGDLRMRFDLSTFTGLGFYQGSQTVRLSAQGHQLAEWNFPSGGPLPDTVAAIPAALRAAGGDLDLQFDVSPPYNPKTLRLSDDDRELGLNLRGVTLEPLQ